MLKYLIPFLTAFLLTVFLMAIVIFAAKKIKWTGRKSKRHIHPPFSLRVGGIAMILAFNLAILLNKDLFITLELYGVMIATLAILAFGLWDDMKEIYWKLQLFFHVAIAVFVFIVGVRVYYVTNPMTGGILKLDSGPLAVLAIVLVIGWIVLVMNALNWLDGLDGLSGGVALISSATMFILSLRPEVNQPPIAILCAIFAGVILAFLIFNFNPSRVLAGTSGAMFMGFILAILAIFSGTKIATAMLVMVIPIIDSFWVTMERIKKKKSIFRADKSHLHHKLLELGWSQKEIALSYYWITFVIAVIALNTRFIGKSVTLMISFLVMVIASFFINKKISAKKRT